MKNLRTQELEDLLISEGNSPLVLVSGIVTNHPNALHVSPCGNFIIEEEDFLEEDYDEDDDEYEDEYEDWDDEDWNELFDDSSTSSGY